MPRVVWPLQHGRPIIEVTLTLAQGRQPVVRRVIADTGAGRLRSGSELLLDEHDCLLCGCTPMTSVTLGGAYVGPFPTYALRVAIPALGFSEVVTVVGLPVSPTGFDGIARVTERHRPPPILNIHRPSSISAAKAIAAGKRVGRIDRKATSAVRIDVACPTGTWRIDRVAAGAVGIDERRPVLWGIH